jgi:hypothetical protein
MIILKLRNKPETKFKVLGWVMDKDCAVFAICLDTNGETELYPMDDLIGEKDFKEVTIN